MTTNTNKIALAAFAAIAIIASAIIASMQTSENQAFAQVIPASRERTISVTGTATDSVKPDLVNIQFGVETEAKTAQEAISTNSAAMTEVVDAIRQLGITEDEINTSNFSIYPVYNNTVDPKTGVYIGTELTGYKASNILSVKTKKITMAGDIIDTAVSAGANRVDSVYFSLSPEKQLAMQDDLIEGAVLNAQSKAEKALSPLGQKIIGVKMVNLSDSYYPPPPIYYGAYDEVAYSAKSTPVFASNQDVTTTANVIFLIGEQ